ncbi:DUF4239 domain-containing protein [Pararhizobium antarcticum]|uniref:DUF4239 domain-containing protein n=1 Tax=Pararhizobium antarcticum TaxID=1798805 RepID=A0A657LNA4_9HYPH|nr:DUF4239 domain-containing protein [Pararhizobium antarcticum]OJF92961.1 hypothetical protein AX760_21800 [Pararhizobium antarcticum]OJF98173.1 hypothetical protein AX761_12480 [Rhizobium sp. 58]
MIQLIYDTPPSILCIVLIVISVALAVGGVEIVSKVEPVDTRHTYNDIVGFVIAVVGVVYAVLLASVAISAWENYDRADFLVEREAAAIGDIARLAQGLPAPTATKVRQLVLVYADTVMQKEWPTMRTGQRPAEALPDLDNVQTVLLGNEPQSPQELVLHDHLLTSLTDLFDARRDRVAMADYGINAIVWIVVLVGNFLLVGVCFMFGLEKRRHQILCGFMAMSTALVVFMIVEMDRPFLGAMGVSVNAIEHVVETISRIPSNGK